MQKIQFSNDIAIEVYADVIINNPAIIQSSNLEKRADDADDRYRNRFV